MAFSRNLSNDKVFFGDRTKKGSVPRLPLRTFTEMAAEFGLTNAQLSYQISISEHNPPKPCIRSHSNLTVSNRYFDPKEMRTWWRRHNNGGEQQ